MKENDSKQALYAGILAFIVLIWVFAYALPRWRSISALEQESQGYAKERQSIANSLATLQRSHSDLQDPQPNTVSWINKNALRGLEKNLDSNNPYGEGKGAQLKLRKVSADSIVQLVKKLGTVNLVIKSFKLEDSDGDGYWNIELMVEVPS